MERKDGLLKEKSKWKEKMSYLKKGKRKETWAT